jgi:hypothetical protein
MMRRPAAVGEIRLCFTCMAALQHGSVGEMTFRTNIIPPHGQAGIGVNGES